MTLLEIKDLSVSFHGVRAVEGVSLSVDVGESVALVGGSGAGKSTVARIVAGLGSPDSGTVTFDGARILGLRGKKARAVRSDIHMVFQDPYASLPPSLTVAEIVAEPMAIHGIGDKEFRRDSVLAAMEAVNLIPAERFLTRYAYELSGGERQRVAFARAVVTKPRLILADEPTSGLDASLRVEIIDLMVRLCRDQCIAILHITHDLALAQRGSDRVVVMQGGRVVESGSVESVLGNPQHQYTAALVAAAARS
ncbi:ABC transporter ATP-binding protein [Rhodococcus sp. ARC_M6]|uniref:ABC transporter ATP-binding protein n=1 Tax=Rhodococcus sp. ARC_M6 TaxID=2928852 RepID=UPI001FB51EC2|nr:dipeptide/oligopeptide/nickel ABC transporter ATP-binding protein [Rhodococcus sp. ARC_M6]MCJ0907445.1 dipeptide/oligopeptide/nickel ABC transporter ATP-binding protein [Rhodococcus sp. ARC_M6]